MSAPRTRLRSRNMPSRSRRRAIQLSAAAAAGLALGPHVAAARPAPSSFDADVGLDAGHSRVDVGASGAGVGEFEHTLDVAFRIKPLLEAAGLSVNLSRADHQPLSAMTHPDALRERVRIEQSARIAAVGKVRLYVSVHFNASGGADPRVSGTETLTRCSARPFPPLNSDALRPTSDRR